MFYIEDNFLPKKEFELLRDIIPKRYVSNLDKHRGVGAYESARLIHHDPYANWEEGCNFLSPAARPAMEKTIAAFKSQGIDPLNYSMWFSYTFDGMRFAAHMDSGLRRSNRYHSYTSIFYTSDWQPGWGGELVIGSPVLDADNKLISVEPEHVIQPLPNRLVFFSRDEPHEVLLVTNPDPSYCRCALGAGWSSVADMKLGKRGMPRLAN